MGGGVGGRGAFFGVSVILTSQNLSSFLFSEIIEINLNINSKKSTMFNQKNFQKNSTNFQNQSTKKSRIQETKHLWTDVDSSTAAKKLLSIFFVSLPG